MCIRDRYYLVCLCHSRQIRRMYGDVWRSITFVFYCQRLILLLLVVFHDFILYCELTLQTYSCCNIRSKFRIFLLTFLSHIAVSVRCNDYLIYLCVSDRESSQISPRSRSPDIRQFYFYTLLGENVKFDIKLGNTILEQVENVCYLGSTITFENRYGTEIKISIYKDFAEC